MSDFKLSNSARKNIEELLSIDIGEYMLKMQFIMEDTLSTASEADIMMMDACMVELRGILKHAETVPSVQDERYEKYLEDMKEIKKKYGEDRIELAKHIFVYENLKESGYSATSYPNISSTH